MKYINPLQFGIAHKDGQVIVQFGKPVAWMAFGPEIARQFADALTNHALEAEKDYQ